MPYISIVKDVNEYRNLLAEHFTGIEQPDLVDIYRVHFHGEIIGYLSSEYTMGRDSFIANLHIHTKTNKRGPKSIMAMIDAINDAYCPLMKARGYTQIVTQCPADNETLKKFIRKFKLTHTQEVFLATRLL